eukprot:2022747-Rhodomonas_salina.4
MSQCSSGCRRSEDDAGCGSRAGTVLIWARAGMFPAIRLHCMRSRCLVEILLVSMWDHMLAVNIPIQLHELTSCSLLAFPLSSPAVAVPCPALT